MPSISKKTAPNVAYDIQTLLTAFTAGSPVLFRGRQMTVVSVERITEVNLNNHNVRAYYELVLLAGTDDGRQVRLRARLINYELVMDYANTQVFHDNFDA